MDERRDDRDEDAHFSEESYSHFAHEGYDEVHKCKCPVPNSFTEIPDLTIDSSLIEATPHWFLLAAGKTEQKVLLEYIKRADISNQKRSTWTRFMMKVWMKYPVKYVKMGDSAKLIPGKNSNTFSPTPKENATFQEIELYIAEDMEKSSANLQNAMIDIILPQWQVPQHSSYSTIAGAKEGIPKELIDIMSLSVEAPDSWYDYPGGFLIHSREHGYVPTPPFPNGIGSAPYRCNEYAWLATTNFQSHHYDTAFTNLGYSSHFMEDLGNPYHTPQIQIILLQYIDDPSFYKYFVIGTEVMNYKALHDNYEGFVNNFWSDSRLPLSTDPKKDTFYEIADSVTDYAAVTDPVNSAKTLAEESWNMNPGLFWDCYWHFAKTGMYNFETNPVIVSKTINRVIQTERYTRGLVHYVTNGKPLMVRIAASAGTGGTITPSGTVSVTYGTPEPYSITANPGYVIDDIKLDGESLGGTDQKSVSTKVQAVLSDHTITATFKPASSPEGIIPLCQAGTPFDSSKYPQNAPYSDPMEFTCSWDGTGRVFISGDKSSLTGVYADDGFTITVQPSGASFDAPEHWAHQHPIVELTSGMTSGSNTFTLIVQNWRRLSMSYGSSTGIGTDQTPYIIQMNYPADAALPDQVSIEKTPFIANESEKEG